MVHASSPTTRRSWLRRLQDWLLPAPPDPAPRAFAPRRMGFGTNVGGGTPYIGEISLFAGNFAPAGWAFCDGSLLPISENSALYALIGTNYGGDGVNNFALPDLRGRAPLHSGNSQGPGLSRAFVLGERAGTESVALTIAQLPGHSHTVAVSTLPGTTASPTDAVPADGGNGSAQYTLDTSSLATQPPQPLAPFGGSQPHPNMQPYLVLNYIISLYGNYPTM